MPFTPFHLGAGAVFKAIGGRYFSFMVFGGSQVLMDIEPLIALLLNKPVLHGISHTLLGAAVIGLVAGVTGKPISKVVLNWLNIPHTTFTWKASFIAAYAGTFSHILLDALMHSDMMPWWPIAQSNGLLEQVSSAHLHLGCMAAGIIGGTIAMIRYRRWHAKAASAIKTQGSPQ